MRNELDWRATYVILFGFAISLLAAASIVAWRYGYDPALGRPLVWQVYNPFAVVGWATSWGFDQEQRTRFLAALSWALLPAIAAMVLVRAGALYAPLKPLKNPTDEALGTLKELAALSHISTSGSGIVLGRTAAKAGSPILRDIGEGAVLVVAPPRGGKGIGFVVPTGLEWDGSGLFLDPKDELYQILGPHRRRMGQVAVLNPTDSSCDAYNPLGEIRLGPHLWGDCTVLAKLITSDLRTGTADPYWELAGWEIITALLVVVMESTDRTLAHLWDVAHRLRPGKFPTAQLRNAALVLEDFEKRNDKVQDSVRATVSAALAFAGDPMIQRATLASAFRAGDLMANADPMTVFLQVPSAEADRLRPLTRLMVQALLWPNRVYLDRTVDGRRKIQKLLLMLDEFPTLQRMDAIEHGLPVFASHGIRAMLIAQDMAQIREAYGRDQSITGCCSTVAFMGGFSQSGTELLIEWCGHTMTAREMKDGTPGTLRLPRVTRMEQQLDVINPAEVLRRSATESLVLTKGQRGPTWVPRVRYYEEPAYRDRLRP